MKVSNTFSAYETPVLSNFHSHLAKHLLSRVSFGISAVAVAVVSFLTRPIWMLLKDLLMPHAHAQAN